MLQVSSMTVVHPSSQITSVLSPTFHKKKTQSTCPYFPLLWVIVTKGGIQIPAVLGTRREKALVYPTAGDTRG